MQIINAGVPGENTRDALKRFESAVAAHHPDCVVMLFGTNDLLNSYNLTGEAEFEINLRTLISGVLALPSQLILCEMPQAYQPYMERRHKPGFFAETPAHERVRKGNAVIGRLAAEFHLPLVQTAELLGDPTLEPECSFRNEANCGTADGVHPTPQGYALLAAAVAEKIASLPEKPEKIVCFGDSITFGQSVEGEGSADPGSETYPGRLAGVLGESK